MSWATLFVHALMPMHHLFEQTFLIANMLEYNVRIVKYEALINNIISHKVRHGITIKCKLD